MQEAYILIPFIDGVEAENPAPISIFACSNQEAFQKFRDSPVLRKYDFSKEEFQIFKMGSATNGWCLVPLKEDFLKNAIDFVGAKGDVLKNGVKFRQCEKSLILDTLKLCGGKKARAARVLGISRRTIYRKLADWEEI